MRAVSPRTRRILGGVAVTVVLATTPTWASTVIEQAPDSLRALFGLDLTHGQLEELSATGVTAVRVATTAERSILFWERDGALYFYPVNGAAHDMRAATLATAIHTGRLVTYVARREPTRTERAVRSFEVVGLQWITSTTGPEPAKPRFFP